MIRPALLATVAARGGSKGVKDKNIRPLLGRPLIAHTLLQLRAWGKQARLVVSTDSEAIAEAARAYGAEVPFLRPAELATDASGKMDALRHCLEGCEDHYGSRFDAVLDLDATAPVRRTADLDAMLGLYVKSGADCVFSVTPARKSPYFNMVELNADGSVSLSKALPGAVRRRQDAPKVFDMNASIYVYRREFLLDPANKMPYSGRAFAHVMGEEAAYDIDTELDFAIVEMIMAREGLA